MLIDEYNIYEGSNKETRTENYNHDAAMLVIFGGPVSDLAYAVGSETSFFAFPTYARLVKLL